MDVEANTERPGRQLSVARARRDALAALLDDVADTLEHNRAARAQARSLLEQCARRKQNRAAATAGNRDRPLSTTGS
jgi:ABC-type transporter Mla subunit MlaD